MKKVKPDRHPCDIKNYNQQIVIIDANCGAAVLRGADIFVPGVVTCTETFVGDIGKLLIVYLISSFFFNSRNFL